MKRSALFRFKEFEIIQDNCTMKVNTDGVLLGAWSDISGKKSALDIGLGTGIIALMIAQKNKEIIVTGVEIDQKSHQIAAMNMQNSPFKDRLGSVNSSIQEFASTTNSKFDLIVSNPPFFSGGTFSSNENKAMVRHTVKLPHIDLLQSVNRLILPNGHFDLILPYLEGLRFVELAIKSRLFPHKIIEVRPRQNNPIERLLIRLSPVPIKSVYRDELIIHNGWGPNEYSNEFVKLTKDFYLFL